MARARPGDWSDPDYAEVFRERAERLKRVRQDGPEGWWRLGLHYRGAPLDFVEDWGVTYDPRRTNLGKSPLVPFVLFERQRQFVQWLHDRMRNREPGVVEKSRDMGISWLMVAFGCWAWLFHAGSSIGYSSYTEDEVDKIGDPDSLFEKIRIFVRYLPEELRPIGWDEQRHANFRRVVNPENGSTLKGEVGDNTGRGGRSTLYFVDEFASFPRQEAADSALSQNTPTRIYASTARGVGNLFYRKRHDGKHPVFTFHWTSDPRKGPDWYEHQKRTLEPVTLAQEVDIDYHASIERVVIPAEWIRSAQQVAGEVGDWPEFGNGVAGVDVGAGGSGKTVLCCRFGPFVDRTRSWQESDTTNSARLAHSGAEEAGVVALNFDEVGVGAGVAAALRRIGRGSGIHVSGINVGTPPTQARWPDGKSAREKFLNLRAEVWWTMRDRFQKTHERLLHARGDPDGVEHPLEELIVLDPRDADLASELAMPTWQSTQTGKIQIESKQSLRRRGVRSPDHAEALSLTFAPGTARMQQSDVEGFY